MTWDAEGCSGICDSSICIDNTCGIPFPTGNATCEPSCNIKVHFSSFFFLIFFLSLASSFLPHRRFLLSPSSPLPHLRFTSSGLAVMWTIGSSPVEVNLAFLYLVMTFFFVFTSAFFFFQDMPSPRCKSGGSLILGSCWSSQLTSLPISETQGSRISLTSTARHNHFLATTTAQSKPQRNSSNF